MSGHNKWSKVKRAKEIKDKAKGNIFSKMSRIITLAVIEGGGVADPDNNLKLRMAVDKARQYNMPKENILRAIDNGVGPDKSKIKEIIYEVFAPKGVVLVILTATDNPNRTLSQIRNIVESHGAKLGNQGSVLYLFKKCGIIKFKKNEVNENMVFSFAQKIDAFDIDQDQEFYSIFFPFEKFGKIKEYLGSLKSELVEVDYRPETLINLNNNEDIKKTLNLISSLNYLDDVQNVYSNFSHQQS